MDVQLETSTRVGNSLYTSWKTSSSHRQGGKCRYVYPVIWLTISSLNGLTFEFAYSFKKNTHFLMVLMKIGSCVIIGNLGLLDKLNLSHKKIHLKSSWPFDDTIMESSIIVSWNQIRLSWQRPVYIIWNWCILVNMIKCPILLQGNTGPNASKATRLKKKKKDSVRHRGPASPSLFIGLVPYQLSLFSALRCIYVPASVYQYRSEGKLFPEVCLLIFIARK